MPIEPGTGWDFDIWGSRGRSFVNLGDEAGTTGVTSERVPLGL